MEKHGSNLLAGKSLKLFNDSKDEVYQVGLTAYNVSEKHSGKYQCRFDRKDDRLQVLSKVHVSRAGDASMQRSVGWKGKARKIDELERFRFDQYAGGKSGPFGKVFKYSTKRNKYNRKIRKKSNAVIEGLKESVDKPIQVEVVSCERGRMMNGVWMVTMGQSTCIRCRGKGGRADLKVKFARDGVDLKKLLTKSTQKKRSNKARYKKKTQKKLRKYMDFNAGRGLGGYSVSYQGRTSRKTKFKRRSGGHKVDLLEFCNDHNDANHNDNVNKHHDNNRRTKTPFKCVGLETFVNVADGGIHESTLTLHNPHPSSFPNHSHVFTCEAHDSSGHKQVRFVVRYGNDWEDKNTWKK